MAYSINFDIKKYQILYFISNTDIFYSYLKNEIKVDFKRSSFNFNRLMISLRWFFRTSVGIILVSESEITDVNSRIRRIMASTHTRPGVRD